MSRGIIDEIAATHGLAPGIDGSILRMLTFGAMNWSISWYDPKGRTPRQIADQLMTLCAAGPWRRRRARRDPIQEAPQDLTSEQAMSDVLTTRTAARLPDDLARAVADPRSYADSRACTRR